MLAATKDQQPRVIASQRVVLPEGVTPAALCLGDGKILDIADDAATFGGLEVTDYGEAVIGPGVVDSHVHINEPGRTHWEGFASATAAAAAGGVTTLIDMPLNSDPVTTNVDALQAKRDAAAGKVHVDVGFYGGLIPGSATKVAELVDGQVCGVKAFLCDSGLDEFPAANEADLREACEVLVERQTPLLAHAELATVRAPTPADPTRYAEYLASRPTKWEEDAIALLIGLSEETGCHVHIVHLANSDALAMISAARHRGVSLSVETCPHYLHFSSEDAADADPRFKCAPPLREPHHREALWRAVADGQIDTIGSDHSPCPPEMKCLDSGDYASAWGGIAGLQLSLSAVVTGARARSIRLERVFQCLSQKPAELFGLGDRKGRLAPGYDADVVVFDPECTWRVEGQQLLHRHKVTPYEQQTLHGQIEATYLAGELVYDARRFALTKTPQGQLLAAHF